MKWLILALTVVVSITVAWVLRVFTGTSLVICVAAIALILIGIASAERDRPVSLPKRE